MRKIERNLPGRTADELLQHLNEAYPDLLLEPCEKDELVRDTLASAESSFTMIQTLCLAKYK
jgi:hypothetical protein